MSHQDELLDKYARTLEALEQACAKAGRKREDVTLVAVSKLHSIEDVKIVAQAGQIDFGENYLQEAQEKMAALGERLSPHVRWHMIGHVQSRKAAQIAGAFSLIHTLDSVRLADALEKKLAALDARQPVLMEVNIAEEPQKAGIMSGELPKLASHVLASCPHLNLYGLMCLPPVFDGGDAARPYFAKLRNLRDGLEKELGISLPCLSMGMSGDFAGAIAEGATIVRIGSGIFGPRPPKERKQ